MAYSSSGLTKMFDIGVGSAAVWRYLSSDGAVTAAAVGYFTAAGRGSRVASSNSSQLKGMVYGDLVLVQESSNGASPGRCSWHSVIGSTASQSSTVASSAWLTSYQISISAHAST